MSFSNSFRGAEDGGSLLAKRCDALGEVVAAEQRGLVGGFPVEYLERRQTGRHCEQRLDHAERFGGARSQSSRVLERGVERRTRLGERVDEADAQSLLRVDRCSGSISICRARATPTRAGNDT